MTKFDIYINREVYNSLDTTIDSNYHSPPILIFNPVIFNLSPYIDEINKRGVKLVL